MSDHPAFWLLVAAVVAPLLAEIPLGFKVPVVVLEVLLGIALGPHGPRRKSGSEELHHAVDANPPAGNLA